VLREAVDLLHGDAWRCLDFKEETQKGGEEKERGMRVKRKKKS
jgi:hypothetical protein